MSIFGRDESNDPQPVATTPTPRPSQPKPVKQVTQISAGTTIEGEISGATEVQIDGTVDGRVIVDSSVRVEANGRVNGEIQAKNVAVAGKVVGNIIGGDKVDIQPSGKLQGDVKAPRVSIADGAYFKGRVEMTGQAAAEPVAPAKPATPAAAVKQAVTAAKPAVPSQPKLDAVPMGEKHK